MSDRAALLAAICANPDEDTPRLVYADWLEENGPPVPTKRAARSSGAKTASVAARAATIRAQIEYHRLATADTAITAVEEFLAHRYENGAERVNWGAVDAGLAALLAGRKLHPKSAKLDPKAEGLPTVRGVMFSNNSRGFVDEAFVTFADEFIEHADAIFRAAPITTVSFENLTAERAEEFAASGHLARVRELFFGYEVEPDAIRVLGTHRDAAGVRKLEISPDGDEVSAAVEALAAGKHWTAVESLEVSDLSDAVEPPEEGQMAQLFARPQFRNVRALTAWSSTADDAAVRAIIKNMPELRKLDLSLNPNANGDRAFAAAKNLRHLRVLDLSSCDMDGGDPAALLTTTNLPNLTVLRLDSNNLSGPNPKVLARSGRGPGLRVLDLGGSQMSEEGFEALVRCPALRGVWHLTLVGSSLEDEHMERFGRSAAFERLTHLDLSINNFTSRGAQALAAWPGAASLQWLDVSNNPVREPGARALADSPHLAGLKYLHATGRGLPILRKRFGKVLLA